MTTHRRKQIRDAVVARLDDLTTTGTRCYGGRTLPLGDGFSPTLLVYSREERSALQAMGGAGRPIERRLRLAVHGYVASAGSDPEDTLDLIALEVERALMADETLGGLAVSLELSATDINVEAGEANRRVGEVRLTYDIEYSSAADDPSRAG